MKRITVTLDDDVYEAALHLSRVSGEGLGKTLSTGTAWTDTTQTRFEKKNPPLSHV